MDENYYFENRRGKWSDKDVPHKGWKCIDIEDLGEPSLTCEMCEFQEIRYVHYMKHPGYKDILKVGCICAGNMEENLLHARKRDEFMRSRSSKRKRWLSRQWKISRNGNEYIKSDGYIITIFQKGKTWNALIKTEDNKFKEWSKRVYQTPDEVKISAFDFLTRILSENE
jgi:hypothetical protein